MRAGGGPGNGRVHERAQLVGGTLRAGASGRVFAVRAELPVAGYASKPMLDASTERQR